MGIQYNTNSTLKQLKFVHTADLHLDTPFKGLSQWNPELAERLKDSTYRALVNITDLCIKEKVDFLLVAGDIFDSESAGLAAQIRFINELQRLTAQRIPVYFICGNHDHLGAWDNSFSIPDGAYRFGSSGVERVTHYIEGEPVADIYGISYKSAHINQNLVPFYRKGENPAPVSIAMLHGMADIIGHDEKYAPFALRELLENPFDYWALGHVHKRRVLNDDPPVVYPGNPQGRDFGETGEKGCYLVEILPGNRTILEFVPVHHVRFEEIEVDLTGVDDFSRLNTFIDNALDNALGENEADRFVLRIRLTGRTSLHRVLNRQGEVEQIAGDLNSRYYDGTGFPVVDSIELLTRPPVDTGLLAGRKDFVGGLIRSIGRIENDERLLRQMLESLLKELPAARIFRETGEPDPDQMHRIIQKAKWLLLDRLVDDAAGDAMDE